MTFTPINHLLHTLLYLSALCCVTAPAICQEISGDPRNIVATPPTIRWYSPLAGDSIKLLGILAKDNVDEITDLAKRLDLVTTVIQTDARNAWHPVPVGTHAKNHLALTKQYDCILIGKIAWNVIPKDVRELIIKHVEQGSGLVYISPYLDDSVHPKLETNSSDFQDLFHGPDNLGLYRTVYSRTAYAFSQLVYYRDRLATSDLPALPRQLYRQSPFYLSSQALGKGRIVALDYDDATMIDQNVPALVPFLNTQHFNTLTKQVVPARRDLWLFGLSMAILHASNRYSNSQVSFLIKSVVPTPRVDRNLVSPRSLREMSPRQFYRYRLPDAEYYVVPPRANASLKTFHYRIRSSFNSIIAERSIDIAEQDKISFDLPMLEQGHYLLDGFYLDKQGHVINSANTSFQVVSVSKIRDCTLPLDDLRNNGIAECELILAQHLLETQHVKISLTDIEGNDLQTIPFLSDAFSRRFRFSLISESSPKTPFVLNCAIIDADGVVVRHRKLIEPLTLK